MWLTIVISLAVLTKLEQMSFLRGRSNGRAEEEHRRQIRKMFDKADKENTAQLRANSSFVSKTFLYQDKSGKLTKEEWHNVLNESGCKTSM